jgi:hypothetical protein
MGIQASSADTPRAIRLLSKAPSLAIQTRRSAVMSRSCKRACHAVASSNWRGPTHSRLHQDDRQRLLFPIGDRGLVDHIVGVWPAQYLQKVELALAVCASGERHLQSERGFWEDRPGSRPDLFTKLLPHDHAELGRLADAHGRGACNGPGLVWEKTGSGLRDGQASAASPDWRNACHRSGSRSSIHRAGWVLIRSSTSRR